MTGAESDQYRILLVEDSATARLHYENMLSMQGHTPTGAADGETAVQHLHTSEFDLVLCDLMLPGMDGFEVYNQFKKLKLDIPFLIITAYGSLDSAVRALRLGADDYILKPIEEELLEHRIQTAMQRVRLVREENERKMLEAALATAGAVAHEMGQPLMILMALAELIEPDLPTERIMEMAKVIQDETQRLGDIAHRLDNITAYKTKPYVGKTRIMDLEAAAPTRNPRQIRD